MTLALIDADILVYESAYRCQKAIEWDEGEWASHASFPDAQIDFKGSVNFILNSIGADDYILALTDSDRDSNFRKSIWPPYKEHRSTVGSSRPLLYKALRQWIREDFPTKEKFGIEADDTIGILATGEDINGLPPISERIMCSVDKDLLTVPGRLFNWRRPDDGVLTIECQMAYYSHLTQTMCGDSSDNFPGLPGCGPKTAPKHLLGPPTDWWGNVVKAFEKKGLTEEDALIQARCARILQASDWDFENERVVLWTPPTREEIASWEF